MKTTKWLMIVILAAWAAGVSGQSFVTPLTSISGDALLTTKEGKEIPGDLKMAIFGPTGIMSLTIKPLDSDEKLRFKAEDVSKLRIKIDGLAKLEMLADKTSNLKKLANADFNEIIDRKYAYYEQVKIPGKDKYVLTQLLNPGFDSKIKVFDKPIAKTGETSINGIAVSGGEARAYYVIAGGETLEINKGKYAKEFFSKLFGSCPEMATEFPKPEFDEFATHVLYFEKICK